MESSATFNVRPAECVGDINKNRPGALSLDNQASGCARRVKDWMNITCEIPLSILGDPIRAGVNSAGLLAHQTRPGESHNLKRMEKVHILEYGRRSYPRLAHLFCPSTALRMDSSRVEDLLKVLTLMSVHIKSITNSKQILKVWACQKHIWLGAFRYTMCGDYCQIMERGSAVSPEVKFT